MIHDQNRMEFNGFLKQLINAGYLEDPALGITKFVIDNGYAEMTPKQNFVFQKEVIEGFVHEECEMCHQEIPWPEMFFAIDKGACAACASQINSK